MRSFSKVCTLTNRDVVGNQAFVWKNSHGRTSGIAIALAKHQGYTDIYGQTVRDLYIGFCIVAFILGVCMPWFLQLLLINSPFLSEGKGDGS